MSLLEYRTNDLFSRGRGLSPRRAANSERNRDEAERGEPRPLSLPRRLVLELTNTCNLDCIMCGRHDAAFVPTYLDYGWLRRLEPILPEVEEVTLMGWGEPTLHPDFVAMLDFLRKHGVRIYFCTNGMMLASLGEAIFSAEVDIIAVSVDGSTAQKNNAIRRGADFNRIVEGIAGVVGEKRRRRVAWPYMNTVTTLTADNLWDFPAIVRLAGELGLEEAKAVYLTAFSERMAEITLWNRRDEVRDVFAEALAVGERCGIDVKLPSVPGDDPAGNALHKTCHQAWRDLFLGSDGYVRPCMSTPSKLFHISEFSEFTDLWRHPLLEDFRRRVNHSGAMDAACAACYQSSHANWNLRTSFIRTDGGFAPEWKGEGTR